MATTYLRAGSFPLSSSRRGSEMSEGLPSPPSSRPASPSLGPAHTPSPRPDPLMEHADIVVDTEPRFSGPRSGSLIERKELRRPSALALVSGRTSPSSHAPSDSDASMETDLPTPAPEPELSPRPPARLLEDERSHVQRSGQVTLRDFDVHGTLGASFSRVDVMM
jgi:hypothetical protein